MRKFLFAASAIAALAAASDPASASVITASACVATALGTPCTPGALASGPSPLLSLPATLVGNFDISGSAVSSTSGNGATFDSQTLQISTTGTGGLIDIYFTITGVPTQQVPLAFTSTFTSNQQTADTHSVIESTWEDNGDAANALTNQLAKVTLTSAVLETGGPIVTTLTPTAAVSFTELYQIQLAGCGDQAGGACTANLTIDLSAQAVPEPVSLALLGSGLIGLGFIRRRHAGGAAA
jgi:hypothetical protein